MGRVARWRLMRERRVMRVERAKKVLPARKRVSCLVWREKVDGGRVVVVGSDGVGWGGVGAGEGVVEGEGIVGVGLRWKKAMELGPDVDFWMVGPTELAGASLVFNGSWSCPRRLECFSFLELEMSPK